MITLSILFQLLALCFFVIGTFGNHPRVNYISAGLALWMLSVVVTNLRLP